MLEQKPVEFTKDTLFKIPQSRMEAKSAITDKTAKAILKIEKAAVDAKTERLRAARLERNNDNQEIRPVKVKNRSQKTARTESSERNNP